MDSVTGSDTDKTWHAFVNGNNEGPMNKETLVHRLKSGKYTAQTSVWKVGMKDWTGAGGIQELTIALGGPGTADFGQETWPAGIRTIAVATCVVIVSFFLPWLYYGVTLRGNVIATPFTYSGFDFATLETSNASGLPGWPYFATLVSAIICLILCGLHGMRSLAGKAVAVAAIPLTILGLGPFVYLLVEIGSWTHAVGVIRFGWWTTILGLLGILVGAVRTLVRSK